MQTALLSTPRWPVNVGLAWITLTLALAIHVVDEATHDFLTIYNANVRIIRQHLPWLPVPTFTFRVWITVLVLAVALLLLLSPFAFRRQGTGVRWIRPLAWLLAILMTLNGLNHIAASIYLGRIAPGRRVITAAVARILVSVLLLVQKCGSANVSRRIYICVRDVEHQMWLWTW